jgi:hypothetical protein
MFLVVEELDWDELPFKHQEALIDEWYIQTIRHIGNAVPHLEKISIFGDTPTIYSGSRKAAGDITKVSKKRTFQGTRAFPCSVQE